MRLVVDTNIVYSAIIKPGKTRRLLLDPSIEPHAPAELLGELEKHKNKLARYLEESAVNHVINRLPDLVKLHRPEEYRDRMREAMEIAKGFDEADAPFIALALHLRVPLWTGDKEVLRHAAQDAWRRYVAVDTRGVELLLQGRSPGEVLGEMGRRYLQR